MHKHLVSVCARQCYQGFLDFKAFSSQPENTHIPMRPYCVLGPQGTQEMEHVWHKAPNVSVLTQTPRITHSYRLLWQGVAQNRIIWTWLSKKTQIFHEQQTVGGGGSYKELCWPSQPWHPWNLASGTLADGDAGTRGTPHCQLQHWNLQQGRAQSARKGGK